MLTSKIRSPFKVSPAPKRVVQDLPGEIAIHLAGLASHITQNLPNPVVAAHVNQWGAVDLDGAHRFIPLIAASQLRPEDAEVMRPFLERGANVNLAYHQATAGTTTGAGRARTPLCLAITSAKVEPNFKLLDLYWQFGAEIDKPSPDYGTPLFMAVHQGQANTVKWLLERGANPQQKIPTSWFEEDVRLSTRYEQTKKTKPEFEANLLWIATTCAAACVDEARKAVYVDILRNLVKPIPEAEQVQRHEDSAKWIEAAVEQESKRQGFFLMSLTGLISGETLLTHAIRRGDPGLMKVQEEFHTSAEINARAESADTPLAAAIRAHTRKGSETLISALLAKGADPRMKVSDGGPGERQVKITQLARELNCSHAIVQKLAAAARKLQDGHSTVPRSSADLFSLADATMQANKRMIAIPLELDLSGQTTLEHAVDARDTQRVQRLVEAGADVSSLAARAKRLDADYPHIVRVISEYWPTFGTPEWQAPPPVAAPVVSATAVIKPAHSVNKKRGKTQAMASKADVTLLSTVAQVSAQTLQDETSSAVPSTPMLAAEPASLFEAPVEAAAVTEATPVEVVTPALSASVPVPAVTMSAAVLEKSHVLPLPKAEAGRRKGHKVAKQFAPAPAAPSVKLRVNQAEKPKATQRINERPQRHQQVPRPARVPAVAQAISQWPCLPVALPAHSHPQAKQASLSYAAVASGVKPESVRVEKPEEVEVQLPATTVTTTTIDPALMNVVQAAVPVAAPEGQPSIENKTEAVEVGVEQMPTPPTASPAPTEASEKSETPAVERPAVISAPIEVIQVIEVSEAIKAIEFLDKLETPAVALPEAPPAIATLKPSVSESDISQSDVSAAVPASTPVTQLPQTFTKPLSLKALPFNPTLVDPEKEALRNEVMYLRGVVHQQNNELAYHRGFRVYPFAPDGYFPPPPMPSHRPPQLRHNTAHFPGARRPRV